MSDNNHATDTHLILWRHAEAEDGVPDAARVLTKRGRKQADAMAAWLKPRLPAPYEVFASPAARACQTADALALPVTTSRKLAVGASVSDVLAAAGWPERRGTAVIVGHQPTLGRVVAALLTGHEADWAVKKGAIWWLASRVRGGEAQVVLRAVLAPDLLD